MRQIQVISSRGNGKLWVSNLEVMFLIFYYLSKNLLEFEYMGFCVNRQKRLVGYSPWGHKRVGLSDDNNMSVCNNHHLKIQHPALVS